jgi:hypothetical protein
MTKILTLLIGLTLLSPSAFAKDDGGFGSGFAGKAPSALGDYTAPDTNALASDASTPANIEPAAGEEEDVQSPEEVLDAPSSTDKTSKIEDAPHIETIDADKAPKE